MFLTLRRVGTPKPQKLTEMSFWYFSRKTWGDKLGGIWGGILVGHSAQQMKNENAQNFLSNVRPFLHTDLCPTHRIVAAISLWGTSEVRRGASSADMSPRQSPIWSFTMLQTCWMKAQKHQLEQSISWAQELHTKYWQERVRQRACSSNVFDPTMHSSPLSHHLCQYVCCDITDAYLALSIQILRFNWCPLLRVCMYTCCLCPYTNPKLQNERNRETHGQSLGETKRKRQPQNKQTIQEGERKSGRRNLRQEQNKEQEW